MWKTIVAAERPDTITTTGSCDEDDDQNLKDGAHELAKNKDVEVIVAARGPKSALYAMKATEDHLKTVVFTTVVDPVRLGLVKTLARAEHDTNLRNGRKNL